MKYPLFTPIVLRQTVEEWQTNLTRQQIQELAERHEVNERAIEIVSILCRAWYSEFKKCSGNQLPEAIRLAEQNGSPHGAAIMRFMHAARTEGLDYFQMFDSIAWLILYHKEQVPLR